MSAIIKFQCFERMIIAKEEKIRRDKLHRRIISKKKEKRRPIFAQDQHVKR